MSNETLNILMMAAFCGVALCAIGFGSLFVAVRKARSDFRQKGFLRPPSGFAWFRFLLWRQYEYFENASIRFYFGTSHVCMIGTFVVIVAMILLAGSEYMLNGMNGFTLGGPGAPTIPQQ